MLSRRSLSLFAVAVATLFTATSLAQEVKIAAVNPAKVFNEIEETKDIKLDMQAKQRALQDDEQRKVNNVEEAKKKRLLYQPGSDEFNKANKELLDKATELQVWRQMAQADLQRTQKVQMQTLFKKIETATKAIAEAKKIDLVLVDQRADLPSDPDALDSLNVDQVRMLINQRTILHLNEKLDMSKDVIERLNSEYKKR